MALDPLENTIGNRFTEWEQVGSTNDLAREWIEYKLARHGDVLFARHQTAGRGQMGKSWLSQPGQNLAMTLLIENARLPDALPFHLSICCALSGWSALTAHTQGDMTLKWPNDLYWKKRKIGGLLIETQKNWSVVGLGINLNQTKFDPSLPNPVSLRQITVTESDPKSICLDIIQHLNQRLRQWQTEGFQPLLTAYRILLFGKNESFFVRENGVEKNLKILDVDEQGALLVEENERRRTIVSGLEWKIEP
ncbi:MAG: biotin--[acetyl-CoA-carboxylase] ligase [Bacteroidetes bacterium]|nr:biotin--[acetyl-CoA-carboxylase] ligase [Bacteroidota bacterium]